MTSANRKPAEIKIKKINSQDSYPYLKGKQVLSAHLDLCFLPDMLRLLLLPGPGVVALGSLVVGTVL